MAGLPEADARSSASAGGPPRNPRELFRLLACLAPGEPAAQGLVRIFDALDLTAATPLDVYRAVLNRAPERLWRPGAGYDAKAHFIAALSSPEFRARAIEVFAAAFSEKRRLIFVHVPKCAGTDLRHNLVPQMPSLPHLLASAEWTPTDAFFAALAACAKALECAEAFLIYGHFELDRCLEWLSPRFDDRIFAIVRDPIEIAVSLANYRVSVMVLDPEGKTQHTRDTYRSLGLERLPENAGPETLKELARRALVELTPANPICSHLASAGKGYAAAVRNIVTRDIEMTDTIRYNAWLREAWGIDSTSRHNESTKFLSLADVEPYRGRLDEMISEDRKLFELVSWALSQAGTASIRGVELINLVAARPGPYRIDMRLDEITRSLDIAGA